MGATVGALAGFPAQLVLAKRSDAASRDRALRADRVEAYSGFAEAIMEWRRSQLRRKKHDLDVGANGETRCEVRDENQRLRAAAWAAFFQVKLLCGDSALEAAARATLEATRLMKRAADLGALDNQGDEVRQHLALFLDAASQQTMPGIRQR